MSEMYLPSVTHVTPMTTIRRERVLPVPGSVTVRVNEKVQAADVVAVAEPTPRHIFIDIGRGLGIPESQVGRHLVRERGDRVESGDVIAGPVGIARRTVRAPVDGRIITLSRGRVLLEVRGETMEIRAGFPGVVVSTDGSRVVAVETTGALIQAVWGNGRLDYGVMRVIGESASERLQTDQLDVNLRGAVLIAGLCDHPAPLHQATELSVRGVILGGMSSELIPVARRLPYPVIVIEGFGKRPINYPAFNLFSSNVGREVALDGGSAWSGHHQRPEAIIPLPASRKVDLPDEVVTLVSGVRIRVIKAPYLGEVGVVREVLPHIVHYPSGVRAKSVAVEVEGIGVATVPISNIEILQ